MEAARPATTPLIPGSKLADDLLTETVINYDEITQYRSAVGTLLYIMRAARPDLCHAAWYLACGMTAPTVGLVAQLKHTLRYLVYSFDFVLRYSVNKVKDSERLDLSSIDYDYRRLVGFSDANFEPNRCVSSCVTMYLNAAFHWRVKKQQRVSTSTVHAELNAMTEESRDLELFRDIFAFVGLSQDDSSVLFSDSRGAIQNAKHPSFSEKLRSALNSIFYIREVVELMICTVRYIPTKLNPADLGTKALGYVLFRLHGQFLMNDTLSAATSADKKRLAHASRLLKTWSRKVNV
jgi:hypothetical protein